MNDLFEIKFISEKKGRGLIAKKDIRRGTLIDIAPVLLIPNDEWQYIAKTVVYNYCFIWDDPKYEGEYYNALALSIMQLMNHSYDPNVRYVYDYEKQIIKFYARKNIKKGEELTINYNGKVDDKSPVWFEVEE
ncbi:MAG: SET domain-containing protein [Promethearchaeia archaeon]